VFIKVKHGGEKKYEYRFDFQNCGNRNFGICFECIAEQIRKGRTGNDDHTAGLVVVLMMIVKEIANLFDAVKHCFSFKISQRRMIKWKYFRLSIGFGCYSNSFAS